MAISFVEKFKQAADDLSAFTARHSSVAVDFNQGYVFTAGTEGVKLWAYQYAYSAIALGMIVQLEQCVVHHKGRHGGHHQKRAGGIWGHRQIPEYHSYPVLSSVPEQCICYRRVHEEAPQP